jgi:hypothetical protein
MTDPKSASPKAPYNPAKDPVPGQHNLGPAPMETVPPDELLTTQESEVYAGTGDGVGPASASVDSVPVETMESLGIGPRDPYPTTEPPPPPPPEADDPDAYPEDPTK